MSYYIGAGWTASGDFHDVRDWWAYLDRAAQRIARRSRSRSSGTAMKRVVGALSLVRLLSGVAGVRGAAQDTRTVVEPKFPASCAVLKAELSPVADTTLAERR